MNIIFKVTRALCLLSCLTLAAQELEKLKPFRHDHGEIRAALNLPTPTAPFTVQFVSANDAELATLSSSCHSQPAQPLAADELCLHLSSPAGTSHHQHFKRPAELSQSHTTLIFRRRADSLQILTPHKYLLTAPAPLSFKGNVLASRNPDGSPCLTDVKYQRLEPIVFGDDFMRTEEEAKEWGLWSPLSGDWKIYSVMERIQANPSANIRPGKIPVPDRSPNPFTLSGKAAEGEAVIIAGQPYWSNYHAEVTAKPADSTFGLIFAFQAPDDFWFVRWSLHSTGTAAAPFQLVRRFQGKDTVLAETLLNGRSDNWWKLGVTTDNGAITAFVDNAPVLSFFSEACTGGKIGLLAAGSHETHFDDLLVSSVTELAPHSLDDLRAFAPRSLLSAPALNWKWQMPTASDANVSLTTNAAPAVLAFGHTAWKEQRATVTLHAASTHAPAGLAAGPDANIQALLETTRSKRILTLRNISTKQTLQSLELPLDNKDTHTLALDTTHRHVVECWLDNTLALRVEDPALPPLNGPVAIVANDTNVTFLNPVFFADFQRDWEKPVDITRFADDPFMQGWASSRYVWLRTADLGVFPQRFLFTGDVYGAFSLKTPVINNLNYVFGNDDLADKNIYSFTTAVDEKTKSATFAITKAGKPLASATLGNLTLTTIPGTQIVDEKIGTRPRTPDTLSWGTVTLHRDGYLLWLEHDGKTIAAAIDPAPLTGRAFAADVPQNLDFIHISLQREHVKDYLFEKAESDWTSLGRWEVTNRFACDPRWSHMNGESFGVAALWSKFLLDGDYTIECFAGMRMRQGELKENARMNYPRIGDINIAFQADGQNLFSGYNLIIGAWDPHWSEKYSQFRKYGDVTAQTDQELIPRGRYRAPVKRAIELDWDPGSRPVHGAWYALKLRKTGKRYDAWFDNRHILTFTDDNNLPPARHLALWTQHNSIVLARVKVNYRSLDLPAPIATPAPTLAQKLTAATTLAKDNRPAPATHDDLLAKTTPWNGDQSAVLQRLQLTPDHHAYLLENVNAGGDFACRFHFPANNQFLAQQTIEFDFAASPDAKINFYVEPNDALLDRCSVTLTGPDTDNPNLRCLGKATLTPIPGQTTDGQPWFHASIPLATLFQNNFPWQTNRDADYAVLGMLHEGYLNAGLDGNHRGAWLLLANFSFRNSTPEQISALPPEQKLHATPLNPAPKKDWNLAPLTIRFDGDPAFAPDLRNASLTVNGQNIPLTPYNSSLKNRTLTITPQFTKPLDTKDVTFTFAYTNLATKQPETTTWTATVNNSLDHTPPTIPQLHFHTYNALTLPGNWLPYTQLRTNVTVDTAYNWSLRPEGLPAVTAAARLCGSKIPFPFNTRNLNAIQYPYLFVDLKVPSDTYIDFGLQANNNFLTLGLTDRDEGENNYLGPQDNFTADDQWHTVAFNLQDIIRRKITRNTLDKYTYNTIQFANYGYVGTQPGAAYAVSNARFAQTVAPAADAPLRLAWTSYDHAGLKGYAYVWSDKPDTEPDTVIASTAPEASFTTLPHGLQFFHLKAQDNNGNWGPTAHQPFFVCTADTTLTAAAPAPNSSAAPHTLTITLPPNTPGVLADKAKITINKRGNSLTGNNADYDEQNHTLTFDLLTDVYTFGQKYDDKTPFTATLTGLRTPAGTAYPDLSWSWNLDFAQDHTPPFHPNINTDFLSFANYIRHYTPRTAPGRYHPAPNSNSNCVLDELTHSYCLEVSTQKRYDLAYLNVTPIDVPRCRFLRFRYRIPSTTAVNLYFRTDLGWHNLQLNGPEDREPFAKHDIIADNQWHWLTLDLQKDVLDKLPPLRMKRFRHVAIGRFERSDTPNTFRIDDCAFVPVVPPAFTFSTSSADASGIAEIAVGASQDYDDTSSLAPIDLPTRYRTASYVLDKPGLWFLSASCRDGAGNTSETVRFPVFCDQPAASVNNDQTLDNHQTYAWYKIPAGKRKQNNGLLLKRLDSASKTAKMLLVQFFGQRNSDAFCVIPTKQLKAISFDKGLKLDLLAQGRAAIRFRAVVIDANHNILASSTLHSASPDEKWHREITLPFLTPLAKDAPAAYLGFLFEENADIRSTILLDNILCLP